MRKSILLNPASRQYEVKDGAKRKIRGDKKRMPVLVGIANAMSALRRKSSKKNSLVPIEKPTDQVGANSGGVPELRPADLSAEGSAKQPLRDQPEKKKVRKGHGITPASLPVGQYGVRRLEKRVRRWRTGPFTHVFGYAENDVSDWLVERVKGPAPRSLIGLPLIGRWVFHSKTFDEVERLLPKKSPYESWTSAGYRFLPGQRPSDPALTYEWFRDIFLRRDAKARERRAARRRKKARAESTAKSKKKTATIGVKRKGALRRAKK
jgi:hypothetical protein